MHAATMTKSIDFFVASTMSPRVEKMKASIRAKVEHPFRVIKRQFGSTKVRYRGLAKNTAQLITLFALSNLWMARRQLMGARGSPQGSPGPQAARGLLSALNDAAMQAPSLATALSRLA